jgi:hypothetical protein
MIRLAAAAAFLALSTFAVSAAAESIDLAATTCAELTAGSTAARKFYVFWFDGYLAAKHGTTVSDADKMQQRLERVLKTCEGDPSLKVMGVMEKADAK